MSKPLKTRIEVEWMSHVVCRMGNTRTGMFVPSAGDTTIPPSLYMCRYAGDIVARRTRWEPPAIVQGVLKGSSASLFMLQKITSVYGHINGLGKRARYLCSPARSDISRMYSGAETWLLLQKHKQIKLVGDKKPVNVRLGQFVSKIQNCKIYSLVN